MSYRGISEQYNITEKIIDHNIRKGLGTKTAIYYGDRLVSYNELNEFTNKVGNGLGKIGIHIEDRVAILCHDSPEFIECILGILKIGAVAVPLNTRSHPNDIEYYLNNCRAKVLIINRESLESIKAIMNNFVYLKHIIVLENENGQNQYEKNEKCLDFNYWIKDESKSLEVARTNKNDEALWLFTSGTTGQPKAVIHLHHDIEFCVSHYSNGILKLVENDITFSASKLFFAYGLGNAMYFPLFVGASTVLIKECPSADVVLKTIEKYRPTVFFGVPTIYGSMIRFIERSESAYDLSSVRLCVSAAEPLPLAIFDKWQKIFNLKILDGIGSTETLHTFISNRIDDIKEGSSGKIVSGYEAKVIGANGETLPALKMGNLMVKGDSIGAGYFNMHEETKAKFMGEWFLTGDKFYVDENGYFFYCGRNDDMLKVGGIWVSPYEIENCLLDSDYVQEAAVVGIKDRNGLIKPKGIVVLMEGFEPCNEIKNELLTFLKQKLADYKCPRDIVFVNELPKTATGKIQRYKLRDMMV